MQIAIEKPPPCWWPFRSNILLLIIVLRKDAYISMTSHMHVKIVEKIEISINLTGTVHCTLMKSRLTGFIDLSFSPNISDPHQDFSQIWQISLKIKHEQPNTNTNANQIQMQWQIRVGFENDWNHRVQVTHVFFRINDCFPTIWHRNKCFSLV